MNCMDMSYFSTRPTCEVEAVSSATGLSSQCDIPRYLGISGDARRKVPAQRCRPMTLDTVLASQLGVDSQPRKSTLIATRSYTAEDLQMARRMAAVAAARCLLLPT
jgi:hypothetical protein